MEIHFTGNKGNLKSWRCISFSLPTSNVKMTSSFHPEVFVQVFFFFLQQLSIKSNIVCLVHKLVTGFKYKELVS